MPAKFQRKNPVVIIGVVLMVLLFIATLYPLVFTIMVSLKSTADFTVNPIGFPTDIRWLNFVDAWTGGNFSVLFLNTVVITVFTIIFTILLASPAGFALAKLNLKGGKLIYNYLILGMIIPFQSIMVPLMKICRQLQAFNYSFTLIAIFTATSIILPVMLYTSFYKSVPDEIVEAAKLDGCGMIRILGKILFPLTKSVNATVAIFVGMYAWRDYLIPSLFATDPNARTLVVGIYNFTGSYFNNWPVIFAAIVIQSIPLVVLFLVFQKSFVDGITSGAVKG